MTAINGTPRPIRPPQRAARTAAWRTSRTRTLRRRALAAAITAALLAGTAITIDAATSTAAAANPTSPGTSYGPIGTGATYLLNPPLGPAGIGPAPIRPGSNIWPQVRRVSQQPIHPRHAGARTPETGFAGSR